MKKKELIEILAHRADVSERDADNVLEVFTTLVAEKLKRGEEVRVSGFGTFSSRMRSARKGFSPHNMKPMQIPAVLVPKFKAGNSLKKYLKS